MRVWLVCDLNRVVFDVNDRCVDRVDSCRCISLHFSQLFLQVGKRVDLDGRRVDGRVRRVLRVGILTELPVETPPGILVMDSYNNLA